MKATAKDLRFHPKELLESVNRGEEVVITYRGKPCAKLIPIRGKRKETSEEENKLFGIWKDNDAVANVEEYIQDMRKGRFNAC